MTKRQEHQPGIERLTEAQREAREGRREAHGALLAAVETSTLAVPCVEDPEGGWTSSDPRAQAGAADRCWDCPVLAHCAAYVDSWPESGGVWAGRLMVPPVFRRPRRVVPPG